MGKKERLNLRSNVIYALLGLIALDFVLIWLWVSQIDPDPSISIGIFLFIPMVFGCNLMIAGVLFFMKKKMYSGLFLLNSFVASTLFFCLFNEGINKHQNNRLERWEFQKSDTIFSLIRWKKTNKFSLTYCTRPGLSQGLLDGHCKKKKTKWIFQADSLTITLDEKNNLIGFRSRFDTIKLKKIKR